MLINKGLFSSKSYEWETPQDFFDELDKEFDFLLDACATDKNAKHENFFTKKDNALIQDWSRFDSVFMNPPYGRKIGQWIKKAYESSQKNFRCTVVCLLPARTDTKWFHDYCIKGEIRFIKGRLYFKNEKNNSDRAPFPSMVVIFRKKQG